MIKLLKRLPVLIIGIPSVYYLLTAAPDWGRGLFFFIVAVLGQYELNHILRSSSKFPILEWAASAVMIACAFTLGERGLFAAFTASLIAAAMRAVLAGLKPDSVQTCIKSTFSIFYLPFCLSCFQLLQKAAGKDGGKSIFILLASVWVLDIGAYIFGSLIRGPKLAPKISPNKTISGAIGGALCSIGFLYAMKHYSILPMNLSMDRFIISAVFIATVGQASDLFESVLKRDADVKDSSSLLGAHGGILDRIDSLLFLGPICYFTAVL